MWTPPPYFWPRVLVVNPGYTLRRQNTEISKQIFPEKEYQCLSPNFHIHASVSDLHIYSHDQSLFCWRKYVDRSWDYINRSQTHECGNWGWGRAIPRKGIHKWDFRCSVWSILKALSYYCTSSGKNLAVLPTGIKILYSPPQVYLS